MAYSYINELGKRITGAAANSHRTYKVRRGPGQQYKHIATYTMMGLVFARGIYHGLKLAEETLSKKRHDKEEGDPKC